MLNNPAHMVLFAQIGVGHPLRVANSLACSTGYAEKQHT